MRIDTNWVSKGNFCSSAFQYTFSVNLQCSQFTSRVTSSLYLALLIIIIDKWYFIADDDVTINCNVCSGVFFYMDNLAFLLNIHQLLYRNTSHWFPRTSYTVPQYLEIRAHHTAVPLHNLGSGRWLEWYRPTTAHHGPPRPTTAHHGAPRRTIQPFTARANRQLN